ncbi:MAG TPA: Fic family protein [Candidatus Nanoarchaeia archaeon]|nr:Fic family protein [Candidatus Nanoarchaeia archaeon]
MVYTEVKKKGKNKYYYRAKSVRKGDKILKERKYLGVNLSQKKLIQAENTADEKLSLLEYLLSPEELKFLEKLKKGYAKEPKLNLEQRYEAFCAQFTYDSNAIEGNTLTLQETAHLLFEKTVPAHKSLREINEALNHKQAFDFLLSYKKDITKVLINHLHRLVVKDTLKPDLQDQVGKYRTLQVYIRGVDWTPPQPKEVPKEMKSLLFWYTQHKKKLHPLILAAYFHAAFEGIHPFVDGNGRVGRLLLNFILHKNKLPMVNIPNKQRLIYYKVLEQAQRKDNLHPLIELLLSLLKTSNIQF